jgi:basic membrane lipoprotein Med (substrate-binding protein (PBP1-ABC) superfamily)
MFTRRRPARKAAETCAHYNLYELGCLAASRDGLAGWPSWFTAALRRSKRMRNRTWLELIWFVLAAAVGVAVGFPAGVQGESAEPLKIGFVYSGPVADVGWTHQHDVTRKELEKEFGSKIKTVYVENMPESADAERVIRQLVADGCKMIITTSFGFMEPTLEVARDFPDVVFEHATGYKLKKNVGV